MPAAVGLFVLCEPIVRVLYERGRFGPVDTAGTAAAVAMYALGVVGLSITKVAVQAFFALGDTRTPVKVSVGAMTVNCVVAAALAGPRPRGRGRGHLRLGHRQRAGPHDPPPTATARPARPRRPPGLAPDRARVGRTRCSGCGRRRLWPPPPGASRETAWLATVIVGATLAYVGCHAALGAEEVRLAWSALMRRWRRSSLRRRETR